MSNKILITPKSFKTYKEKAYLMLKQNGFEVIENTLGRTMTQEEIIQVASEGVVGIIIGIDPLPADVLEKCKDLKAISKYGVGMDNIDLNKAKELGIKVNNAVGTNNVSVGELAIALMFALGRNIPRNTADVKEGRWDRKIGVELTDKKLGLIGGGLIGKEVAKRAVGLQMKVSIFDPYFNDEAFLSQYGIDRCYDIEELYKESDIISLHLPVTKDTKEFMNKDVFSKMKSSALLINTSRGELVNESDLYEALVNGEIAGAAQDVFSSEPPAKEEKLLTLDNFILTSHIGAFTNEAVEKMVITSTQNLLDMLLG